MQLYLIDGIGPFFRNCHKRRINWSKIPFEHIEIDGRPAPGLFHGIQQDFERVCEQAAGMGYNAVTLDDVAHLALHPQYTSNLQQRIRAYREAYQPLLTSARKHDLKVFLTTDIAFFPEAQAFPLKHFRKEIIPFLREVFRSVFSDLPDIAGIITRIGECDGRDVHHDFKSRLVIRRPSQARRLLKELLPLFEEFNRLLIFRTWTVGAHPIGDLMWNRHTYNRTFDGIDSPNLIVSLKYGESDFFRYLSLNRLFFHGTHNKIIELQTRREYEGFGEYPSFTGWDYEQYAQQLAHVPQVIGLSVWCQTGGWAPFRRRTFIDNSPWVEINTFTTLHIFRDHLTTEQAVKAYCREHLNVDQTCQLLTLLRLSDDVIKQLLYIDDFARKKKFFRRFRVPPLLTVFWNYILINHTIRKVLRCFVRNGPGKIEQGTAALQKIEMMKRLALELALSPEDLDFMYDTFEILAAARRYYFAPYSEDTVEHLQQLKARYKQHYRRRYAVKMDFTPMPIPRARFRRILQVLLRRQRGYRLLDRLFMIRSLSLLAAILRPQRNRLVPDFAHSQAMGIDTVLK